ncbi:MAG: D-alanyl-D-alanine carboxypeptidase/D-alanyl-D-alanine-endopeptidase [Planctomycetota bacterium]|nr:D-alanyl-D-alanine carboxypeptidase/D-alanyl-D-alanine-endopeptidase [Planctomycetota bacterium]
MNSSKHLRVSALAFLLVCALAAPPLRAQTANENLASDVERLVLLYRLSDSKVGVVALDLRTGTEIVARNATEALIPASNAKLLTTAAALDCLGADFEFVTTLYRTGPINGDGVIEGDLVVKGAGDPNISGRFFDGNVCAVFEKWAGNLRKLGVKRIGGDIVLDDTIFDREFVHPAWPDEQLAGWYCAPVSALVFNDSCVDITVKASAVLDAPAQVVLAPPTEYVTIKNKVTTTSKKAAHSIALNRKPGANTIEIRGEFWQKADALVESVTVENPTMYFGAVLRETLARQGIECAGRVRCADAPFDAAQAGVEAVARSRSSLAATIEVANKRSQNLYAEQLLKRMGWQKHGTGSFANGSKVVGEFLEGLDCGKDNFSISDGSGLSRLNRASAEHLVGVLRWALGEEARAEIMRNSLSVSGVDGTLAKRMTDPLRKGRVLGKTGYISGVSTLSGYVLDANGSPAVAFSVLINWRNPKSAPKPFQDSFCGLLVSWVDRNPRTQEPTPGGESEGK